MKSFLTGTSRGLQSVQKEDAESLLSVPNQESRSSNDKENSNPSCHDSLLCNTTLHCSNDRKNLCGLCLWSLIMTSTFDRSTDALECGSSTVPARQFHEVAEYSAKCGNLVNFRLAIQKRPLGGVLEHFYVDFLP